MAITNYVWDELSDSVLLETADEGAVEAKYTNVPELFGEPVSQNRNVVKYFHYDSEGSTRDLTDEAEDVSDTFVYSAFGEIISVAGVTVTPYQYRGASGYYTDGGTGDVYVRRRTFQAGIGRWMSDDPAGFQNGPNTFAYVENTRCDGMIHPVLHGQRASITNSGVSPRLGVRQIRPHSIPSASLTFRRMPQKTLPS